MPDLPGGSSAAPTPVPHHVDDDRRAVIGHHHHLHAVGQREGLGVEHGGAEGRCAGKRRHQDGKDAESL